MEIVVCVADMNVNKNESTIHFTGTGLDAKDNTDRIYIDRMCQELMNGLFKTKGIEVFIYHNSDVNKTDVISIMVESINGGNGNDALAKDKKFINAFLEISGEVACRLKYNDYNRYSIKTSTKITYNN